MIVKQIQIRSVTPLTRIQFLSLWRLLFKQRSYFGFSYHLTYLIRSDVSEECTASSCRVGELGSGGSIHMNQNPVGTTWCDHHLILAQACSFCHFKINSDILFIFNKCVWTTHMPDNRAPYRPSWEQLRSNKETPCNLNTQRLTKLR